ncbi:hypothetical protein DKK48_RS13770 [Enterococcus faecalis]|uniref:hypothetical protein n=1 Tax=Bacteria TaxID=2 RepID=UPI00030C4166|nr:MULTISPECIES: hypothetical protein [Bacteria]EGO2662995.1 hypothetical protein [Enterococcus faecalis]EGO5979037.1 hypothetical protein [Enterococcus faecalis]EGO8595817.1 hypothetical protein [Enterococcus faecalis]EHB6425075.1 hypothetical protein [Enterococcus faecalis]EIB6787668.1 hypothetical protein [Enterococcus faecalis]
MQLEIPDLFRPLGSLKKEDEIPLEKPDKKNLPKIDKGFPPYDSDKFLNHRFLQWTEIIH